jgi:hypothetical protein
MTDMVLLQGVPSRTYCTNIEAEPRQKKAGRKTSSPKITLIQLLQYYMKL